MNTSKRIRQNGKPCGYVDITYDCKLKMYKVTLNLFGVSVPAQIETRQTLEEAQTAFYELLSAYSY